MTASVLDVRTAVATVNDPEYPDVSIVDLGLLESVDVHDGVASVGLIPTFSGCPALDMIATDVRRAVESLTDIDRCAVTWLSAPVWSADRLSPSTPRRLEAEYTVTLRRKDGRLRCPVCGSDTVEDQAMAGPTRCRSVAWCADCRNPVEVMRAHVDLDAGMARDHVMRAHVDLDAGMARDGVMRAHVDLDAGMARDGVLRTLKATAS